MSENIKECSEINNEEQTAAELETPKEEKKKEKKGFLRKDGKKGRRAGE